MQRAGIAPVTAISDWLRRRRRFPAPGTGPAPAPVARAPQAIHLNFSNDVGASLSSAWASGEAVTITNLTTGQNIGPAQLKLVFNQTDNSAILSFIPGLFPDGRYQLELNASAIHGPSGLPLDGNQNGVAGDDFVFDFFQLSGDVDRDGKVEFSDLVTVAQKYGQPASSYAQGDLNGDGTVSFADLVAVAQNYNKQLPAPLPAATTEEPLASLVPALPPSPAKPVSSSVPPITTGTKPPAIAKKSQVSQVPVTNSAPRATPLSKPSPIAPNPPGVPVFSRVPISKRTRDATIVFAED
jgi:hypothetical protein